MFIGVRCPRCARSAASAATRRSQRSLTLLRSRVHEERTLALLLLVDAFKPGDEPTRRAIYDLVPREHRVHQQLGPRRLSAAADRRRLPARPQPVPADAPRAITSLWERRIAIVATFHFIRHGELDDTFRIADLLLHDDRTT